MGDVVVSARPAAVGQMAARVQGQRREESNNVLCPTGVVKIEAVLFMSENWASV